MNITRRVALYICMLVGGLSWLAATDAVAASFSYTPNVANNSVLLEGLVPTNKFMNIPLPQGSVEFDDGTLAVNTIPNWNFDRVPLLQGPIIRTDITTNGRQALVSGLVLFTQGYWYDKYWTPGSTETLLTNGGLSVTGRISDLTATSLTVTGSGGTMTTIPFSDIKELHSPRAFVFAVPALAANPVTPDIQWTADVRTVSLAATVAPAAGPVVANLRRDPLLNTRDEGDWSTRKMWVVGTLLSIANTAQFTPELILPQLSHQLWQHNNKKSFFTQTHPIPEFPAPLAGNGNTYTIAAPFNATH